jgi:hypothetical protein
VRGRIVFRRKKSLANAPAAAQAIADAFTNACSLAGARPTVTGWCP